MKSKNHTLTPTALKRWAYRKIATDMPVQLDEISFVLQHSKILFDCINDKQCPQRGTILSCLYTHVGRIVSSQNENIDLIQSLLNAAVFYDEKVISNWVIRSKIIMKDLRKYDYVEWCQGGFARKDIV